MRSSGDCAVVRLRIGRRWRCRRYGLRLSPELQRVYLDQLEQGDYNAYAGGLLLTPLLARYHFLSTLGRTIAIATHEGYSLEELALTLFSRCSRCWEPLLGAAPGDDAAAKGSFLP